MKNLVFLISVLFLSVSFANIRVGRTGGGLGEMKAYSVVNQLLTIVKICTTSKMSCGMNDSQRAELLRLSQTIDLQNIELAAPWSGATKFSGQMLAINSNDLYSGGIPKRFGEILGLCLAVLLRDGLHLSESSARWPLQVFSNFQENMRSLDLSNVGMTLHSLSLQLPGQKGLAIQALALEKAQVTEDLSGILTSKLGCLPVIWKIEAWNYVAAQNWVRAQILWNCGNNQWTGELQLLLGSEGLRDFKIVRKSPR